MFSELYFEQLFSLIPEKLRPADRKTFQAYDGINNIFNLAYEALSWRVHRALISAKLEPYLGFLHSVQEGKPSLVCDFMELYRYLVDDFVIQYCRRLKTKDFTMKTEALSRKKTGKREYLDDFSTKDLMHKLDKVFVSKITSLRNVLVFVCRSFIEAVEKKMECGVCGRCLHDCLGTIPTQPIYDGTR